TFTSTLEGKFIGSLPIRDIVGSNLY
ncbi:MAG: hypothetical protein RIQ70_1300, partial [Bacteroidota bacterium]